MDVHGENRQYCLHLLLVFSIEEVATRFFVREGWNQLKAIQRAVCPKTCAASKKNA